MKKTIFITIVTILFFSIISYAELPYCRSHDSPLDYLNSSYYDVIAKYGNLGKVNTIGIYSLESCIVEDSSGRYAIVFDRNLKTDIIDNVSISTIDKQREVFYKFKNIILGSSNIVILINNQNGVVVRLSDGLYFAVIYNEKNHVTVISRFNETWKNYAESN